MRTLTYDPNIWADFKANTQINLTTRFAHVKLAEPGSLYAMVDGKAQLVHYGTEFKVEFPHDSYVIKASVAGALFVDAADAIEDENDVLTNMDKRPGANGAELMFHNMLRMEQLKKQSAAIEAEKANKAEAKRRIAKGLTDKLPEGVKEDEPEPENVLETEPSEKPESASSPAQ